jgi:hypothetical protein
MQRQVGSSAVAEHGMVQLLSCNRYSVIVLQHLKPADDIAGPASEQPQQSSQPHRQAQGQAQQGQGKGSKKSRQKG